MSPRVALAALALALIALGAAVQVAATSDIIQVGPFAGGMGGRTYDDSSFAQKTLSAVTVDVCSGQYIGQVGFTYSDGSSVMHGGSVCWSASTVTLAAGEYITGWTAHTGTVETYFVLTGLSFNTSLGNVLGPYGISTGVPAASGQAPAGWGLVYVTGHEGGLLDGMSFFFKPAAAIIQVGPFAGGLGGRTYDDSSSAQKTLAAVTVDVCSGQYIGQVGFTYSDGSSVVHGGSVCWSASTVTLAAGEYITGWTAYTGTVETYFVLTGLSFTTSLGNVLGPYGISTGTPAASAQAPAGWGLVYVTGHEGGMLDGMSFFFKRMV